MPHLFILILVILLAIASFFLSASETAVIGLSKIRLRHMLSQGVKGAQHVQNIVNKLDKFIAAILIGNNLVNIAISAIITALCVPVFGFNWGVTIATFGTAFFVLVFCEITPKILATKHSEKISLFIAPIMEVVITLFDFSISFFINISNFLLKIIGVGPTKRSPLVTEEELRLMIEVGKEEGVLSDEERRMLHKIFEFGDIKAGQVMVPKEKIVAININFSSEDLFNVFVEQGHARLPVYSGSVDNIVGVIYARDLLYIMRDKGLFLLQDLMHAPYHVLPSMRVNELLRKFQADKIQIAIVADEKKKTLGMVTLEDLVEEIVGEIEEDHNHRVNKN